jgi:four helix bundle protein
MWAFAGGKWAPAETGQRRPIRSHRDLDVYNLAYTLAMEVFRLTAKFPRAERYTLTDQVRRPSRSVCGNIVEGFARRSYAKVFKNALNDSLGESEETKLWLDFALDCGYVSAEKHRELTVGYEQTSAMLWTLMNNWRDRG